VVIGGDVHAYWVADLKRDFDAPSSPVVASELVSSSITSQGPLVQNVQRMLRNNPHLRFAEGERRGYVVMSLGQRQADIRLRAIADVTDPATGIADLARFAIESGRPGAQQT